MPLPDQYCVICITRFVPMGTKLSDLKEMGPGNCDSCGNVTTLYELPQKNTGDWMELSTKVFVRCVRCGRVLKVIKSGTAKVSEGLDIEGFELTVEVCECAGK